MVTLTKTTLKINFECEIKRFTHEHSLMMRPLLWVTALIGARH